MSIKPSDKPITSKVVISVNNNNKHMLNTENKGYCRNGHPQTNSTSFQKKKNQPPKLVETLSDF